MSALFPTPDEVPPDRIFVRGPKAGMPFDGILVVSEDRKQYLWWAYWPRTDIIPRWLDFPPENQLDDLLAKGLWQPHCPAEMFVSRGL